MPKLPEISIITAAHNCERFIAETIDSVISQTFKNWELIVVDDGSTDGTYDTILSYVSTDSRIRLMELGWNSGRPAVPRNHAIEQSRGAYIAFLDSDDLWLPEKLEYQLCFMKSNNLELSYGATKIMIGEKIYDSKSIQELQNRRNLLKSGNIACLTVMMRNRSEYRPVFDEEPFLKAAEDTYAWIQIHKKTDKIACYERPLSIYRVNGRGSISSDFHSDVWTRMSKQFLYYSKLHLTDSITDREALHCYLWVLYKNALELIHRALLAGFRRVYPRKTSRDIG